MNWVRRIMLAVGLLLIVAIVAAYLLPRHVRVERTATIAARQATLFTAPNSFTHFNKWSPWFELDPQANNTYEGPGAGIGAKLSWGETRRNWGRGVKSITASAPYATVAADVDFGQGGSPAKQVYALGADGAGTRVPWSMDVDLGMNPIGRYMGLGFDGMIGRDFDKGLALLKTFAEGLPKADFAGLENEAASVEPVTVGYVSASSAKDDAPSPRRLREVYGEVGAFMKVRQLNQAGAPITIDTGSSDTGYLFDAAIPVDKVPATPTPQDSRLSETDIRRQGAEGGAAGPVQPDSRNLRQDRRRDRRARDGNQRQSLGRIRERPTTVKESEILTNVYFPIK